ERPKDRQARAHRGLLHRRSARGGGASATIGPGARRGLLGRARLSPRDRGKRHGRPAEQLVHPGALGALSVRDRAHEALGDEGASCYGHADMTKRTRPDTATRELFGTDGVRGLANRGAMTPETAFRLGMAVTYQMRAERHHAPRIVVGKDTRVSGYLFESALASGICAMGRKVLL